MRRLTPLLVCIAMLVPATLFAGWKKPYFTATKVGSWAKYTTKSTAASMSTTVKRLPDKEGQQQLELKVEFASADSGPNSLMHYTLRKGYSLENDGIDYMQGLAAGEYFVGDSTDAQQFEPTVIDNIVKAAQPYVLSATYKATETIDGRSCDHYTYSIKHPGDPVIVENGDLWMAAEVPFGLVQQKATLKEGDKVRDSFEQKLVNWGTK